MRLGIYNPFILLPCVYLLSGSNMIDKVLLNIGMYYAYISILHRLAIVDGLTVGKMRNRCSKVLKIQPVKYLTSRSGG